ncbi:MAG: ABC transporter permease, partial [Burkholderiales bacterium]
MNKQREKSGSVKRSLFLRLWLRSLTVKRPQAALALGAILVGAALAAALLNLHRGVARKMTQEFRAYGANAIVSARGGASGASQPALVGDEILAGLSEWKDRTPGAALAPMLHVVMRLRPAQIDTRLPEFQNVVVVGSDFPALRALYPNWRIAPAGATAIGRTAPMHEGECVVGTRVATQLRLVTGSELLIEPAEAPGTSAGALRCRISAILSTGAAEDDRVFVPLAALQQATALEGKQSLVELLIPGEAAEINRAVAELGRRFPAASVRPVRAIVESQGRVLGTIRWLLVSLT